MDLLEAAEYGIKPTPTVCEPFIVAFVESHGIATRAELVAAIETAWEGATRDVLPEGYTTGRVKKALNRLINDGVLASPILGHYVLAGEGDVEPLPLDAAFTQSDPHDVAEDAPATDLFEREIGDGAQSVYAFYLPTFRVAAEACGEGRWPIKIGMTTASVVARMDSFRTALPEMPVLALRLRVDDASAVERVIHGVLALRGQRVEQAGGSEWFLTTPHEIEAIYNFIRSTQSPPTESS